MKNTIPTMIAILGLAAAAPSAQGQGYNPFQIGASGGIAFPTGDLGTGTNTGYNIAVVVGYKPQLLPISVRAEAAYNQFGRTGGGSSVNIPSFTGNVVYELPLGMSFTPYAIGGAGLYRPSVGFNSGGATSAENDFGWNIEHELRDFRRGALQQRQRQRPQRWDGELHSGYSRNIVLIDTAAKEMASRKGWPFFYGYELRTKD